MCPPFWTQKNTLLETCSARASLRGMWSSRPDARGRVDSTDTCTVLGEPSVPRLCNQSSRACACVFRESSAPLLSVVATSSYTSSKSKRQNEKGVKNKPSVEGRTEKKTPHLGAKGEKKKRKDGQRRRRRNEIGATLQKTALSLCVRARVIVIRTVIGPCVNHLYPGSAPVRARVCVRVCACEQPGARAPDHARRVCPRSHLLLDG